MTTAPQTPAIPLAARRFLKRAATMEAKITAEREASAARIKRLQAERRALWLAANRAGARYVDIQEIAGVSDGLVCREISAAIREAR